MKGGILRVLDHAPRGACVVLLSALAAFAMPATGGAAVVADDRQVDQRLQTQPSVAPDNDSTVIKTNAVVVSTVPEVHGTLVQTIDTSAFSPSSPDPAGITYLPQSNRFLISDSEVEEMPIYQGSNFFTVTPAGSGVGTGTSLAFSAEPTGISYDPATQRLFVADDDSDRISVVTPGGDGVHGTGDDVWTRFGTAAFGNTDAEGVAYDQETGHLFICDGVGTEIYELDPVNGVFGDAGDVVTHFDIGAAGAVDCEGVALDAARDALLAIDPSTGRIYDFTFEGELTRVIRLTAIKTTNTIFADLVLAPSSDPNDSPAKSNLWIVDRHIDNGTDPNENDGLLYEIALPDETPPSSAPADFDGDGDTDLAIFRPSTGLWAIRGQQSAWAFFGEAGDMPVPGDYDGDGDTDLAIFRPSTGLWAIRGQQSAWAFFGQAGDVPVPGDYDGDGDTDLAIFRPSTGLWAIRLQDSGWAFFGQAGDVPVPGDYDGDGDTDLAIFRPSTGLWAIRGQQSAWAFFGQSGDVPVPGDYDRDGDTDLAIFRPSTGLWAIRLQDSAWAFFGDGNDIPLSLPAALRSQLGP